MAHRICNGWNSIGCLLSTGLLTSCTTAPLPPDRGGLSLAASIDPVPETDPVPATATVPTWGKVMAVTDGDSIVVQVSPNSTVPLRLCGIDAPEMSQPAGKDAKAYLQSLLDEANNTIGFVVQTAPQSPLSTETIATETIAEVFLPQASVQSGSLVNAKLVEAGLAHAYPQFVWSCAHGEAIDTAEQQAQQAHEGVWQPSDKPVPPWSYRQQPDALVRLPQAGSIASPQALSASIDLASLPNLSPEQYQASEAYLSDGLKPTLLGVASWYGDGLHGQATANGESFDKAALTAAHASLPFDTNLQVTNLKTRRSVIVRINDRPRTDDPQFIDLSKSAADRIGGLQDGLISVEMQIVEQGGGSSR